MNIIGRLHRHYKEKAGESMDQTQFEAMQSGDRCCGFRLLKKEYMAAHDGTCYTMQHEKSGAQLLYFDRADENKTFSIAFTTLPEDNTGVFHILEHSLLNGSEKFPVKEPFVSLLQSSMQTFLNAMTFSDKTLFPVSSRNEEDLFHLMTVYMDGVFRPLIYSRPEIFMQEGWHYEFEDENAAPYYNGVVFSEMKGAFADVDQVIQDETQRMLFPDTCYGYTSGGRPEEITDLTYEKFLAAHRRFYHPSNAKIILDGHMDVERFLRYFDEEYLSKYEYQKPDFAFVMQKPKAAEKTVFYEAQEGEETLAHMSIAKILCAHDETEKIYAAKVLADYLTGSNEAPLKRALLEQGLAQDVYLAVNDQVLQPSAELVIYNTTKDAFAEIRARIPDVVKRLAAEGLDQEALSASMERFAFQNREINEPYGVELVSRALGSWLYGDDPLTDLENGGIFEALRKKVQTGYFEQLLLELLGDPETLSYLYVLPSLTKGEEDAKKEVEKAAAEAASWDETRRQSELERFSRMQEWQQSPDTEEALNCLPHLELADVPQETKQIKKKTASVDGVETLQVEVDTNGIAYVNLYFDISDFQPEEIQMISAMTACFGELRTEHYTGEEIQKKTKALLGSLGTKIEVVANQGNLKNSRRYLLVSASMLEENVPAAVGILEELLLHSKYDETDKIYEIVLQSDYMMKQALIGNGHQFAITRAVSAFSDENAWREWIEGESFVRWFGTLSEDYEAHGAEYGRTFERLSTKAFAKNRLFVGYSGVIEEQQLRTLIEKLPEQEMGDIITAPKVDRDVSRITIPASVGFSALGNNVYALGSAYSGKWAVLSSILSFDYLWNAIRVQGGAYGTGMSVQKNGNLFVYSYRDPNLENTREVYRGMAEFLEQFLSMGIPLEDRIIGTLNTADPLVGPAFRCELESIWHLKGLTGEWIAQIRRDILTTTPEDLRALAAVVKAGVDGGKFCVVGDDAQIQNV